MTVRLLTFAAALLTAGVVYAQTPDYTRLEPDPYDPATEPDIDLFISTWKTAPPVVTYGALVERDVFTKSAGDPLNPDAKGAVLTYLNRFTYGILRPGGTTTPATLEGEQLVLYITGGTGTITAGGTTAELHGGVGAILPPGISFTMHANTGKPLTMYILAEPIPADFTPLTAMKVTDENRNPINGTTGHWDHVSKQFFSKEDGLAVLGGICPVWYDKMTMGQPHSHNPGFEEIWFVLEGTVDVLLGKELRTLEPGMAYKVPPDYMTPHSNINVGDEPVKVVWFIIRTVPEPRSPSLSMLAYKPHDPATDPDIDIFTGSWRASTPARVYGNLLERDILTPATGDALRPATIGAVLTQTSRLTHATVFAGNVTEPATPKDTQEVFYILEGEGELVSGGKAHWLRPGVAALVPAGVEFFFVNTGDDYLTMYHLTEPVPAGFTPKKAVVVRDEATIEPVTSTRHWTETVRPLLTARDGLATVKSFDAVSLAPMSFTQPHSHAAGDETLCCAVEGPVRFLMGQQIRDLAPGAAYAVPLDGRTAHAPFNTSPGMTVRYLTITCADDAN